MLYVRGAQPIWAQGRSILLLVHSKAEDKIISWESHIKNQIYLNPTSRFIAYGLIIRAISDYNNMQNY